MKKTSGVGDERPEIPKPVDVFRDAQRYPRSLKITQSDPARNRGEDAGELEVVGGKIGAVRAHDRGPDLHPDVADSAQGSARSRKRCAMPSTTPPTAPASVSRAMRAEARAAQRSQRDGGENPAIERHRYRIVEKGLALDDRRQRRRHLEPPKYGDDGDRVGCAENRPRQERRRERYAHDRRARRRRSLP